jgi:hypothetical protein
MQLRVVLNANTLFVELERAICDTMDRFLRAVYEEYDKTIPSAFIVSQNGVYYYLLLEH